MFGFLNRERKTAAPAASETRSGQRSAGSSSRPDFSKQREMVRLALTAVLRQHGIAARLLECELMPLARSNGSHTLLTQLVVRQWHDGLLRYAPAIEQAVLREVKLFDSKVDTADFVFVWKFAPECGYPHGALPEASFWSQPAATHRPAPAARPAAPAAQPKPKPKFDLPDRPIGPADGDDEGFEPTQVHDFR